MNGAAAKVYQNVARFYDLARFFYTDTKMFIDEFRLEVSQSRQMEKSNITIFMQTDTILVFTSENHDVSHFYKFLFSRW